MKRLMVKGITATLLVVALAFPPVTSVFAAGNPNGTGQPNQNCEMQTSSPPGFTSSGFANAQNHYAGSQPQSSNNPSSVSQYDVACYQVSHH